MEECSKNCNFEGYHLGDVSEKRREFWSSLVCPPMQHSPKLVGSIKTDSNCTATKGSLKVAGLFLLEELTATFVPNLKVLFWQNQAERSAETGILDSA